MNKIAELLNIHRAHKYGVIEDKEVWQNKF